MRKTPFTTKENKDSPDHLYYNIKITNENDTVVPANYVETRTSTIINDSLCKYEVAVVRFKIPNNVPIFVFQANTYYVNLVDSSGGNHPFPCQWIANNVDSSTQNFVYEFSEWSLSVTNALLQSYNDIPIGIRPANPPFVLYDPVTTRYSLYATSDYYPQGATKICMNNPCEEKFGSWPVLYGAVGTNTYATVLINQMGNNAVIAGSTTELNTAPAVSTVTYYKIQQQINSLFLLSDFDSLLLRCVNLPVFHEQDSSQTDSNDIFVSIMTDFEPIQNNTFNDNSYFQYNPAVYRWASLFGNQGLRSMDLSVYFRTIDGTVYPLQLYYNQEVTVKLAFRKKSTLIHKE